MAKRSFVENGIYHVYNRGTDKRDVFINNDDYFRFVHDLFEFNDEAAAINIYYKQPNILQPKSYEVGLRKVSRIKKEPRKLLVKVLAFCLMPNHFHLLLQQIKGNGITEFMRKLGTGYTNYFNKKYERDGVLFQGKFKAIAIDREEHLLHTPYYIHLNPLDLKFPEWRERELRNLTAAIKLLESYRWSSYLDYIGMKNFPSVTQREFLMDFYNGPHAYKKASINWFKDLSLETLDGLTLE